MDCRYRPSSMVYRPLRSYLVGSIVRVSHVIVDSTGPSSCCEATHHYATLIAQDDALSQPQHAGGPPMPTTPHSDDPLVRVEGLLTQLLIAAQHQAIDIARIQDEITALRQTHSAAIDELHDQVMTGSQRTDWFHVRFGGGLGVALRGLRGVRRAEVDAG